MQERQNHGGGRESELVLLTGATGFVGRHLYPALRAAGYNVRCGSRQPARATELRPKREWVRLDLDEASSVRRALEGCRAAIYLVHRMKGGDDYPDRERRSAEVFAREAERAGVRRIVYLGGVAPRGKGSRHLASRLETGAILRRSRASTVEIRAAMIIGAGGESWTMVRDLAKRLPLMVLPRWLNRGSWPIAIDDVVLALVGALQLHAADAGVYDAPGPERLTHRETLERAAAVMGKHPTMLRVPVLTPRLSSYWIGLVTDVDVAMARELIEGIRYDLDPSGRLIWDAIGTGPQRALDEAMREALADRDAAMSPAPPHAERLRSLIRQVYAPAES